MLPDFLSEFYNELEHYKLNYLKITAKPLRSKESLSLTQSKFLGKPFLPTGVSYPYDVLGKPMLLLAQLNFAEAHALEGYPSQGILQLFVSATEWYDTEPKSYRILYHPDLAVESRTDFSFLTPDLYAESPISVEHALSFSKAIDYGEVTDCRFRGHVDFAGSSFYGYYETLPKTQQQELDKLFLKGGHKIGGYATFTQEDPRECTPNTEHDLLLLQIDTDKKIMFGDAGVAHLLISPEALHKQQFDRAYFNWDCF